MVYRCYTILSEKCPSHATSVIFQLPIPVHETKKIVLHLLVVIEAPVDGVAIE